MHCTWWKPYSNAPVLKHYIVLPLTPPHPSPTPKPLPLIPQTNMLLHIRSDMQMALFAVVVAVHRSLRRLLTERLLCISRVESNYRLIYTSEGVIVGLHSVA